MKQGDARWWYGIDYSSDYSSDYIRAFQERFTRMSEEAAANGYEHPQGRCYTDINRRRAILCQGGPLHGARMEYDGLELPEVVIGFENGQFSTEFKAAADVNVSSALGVKPVEYRPYCDVSTTGRWDDEKDIVFVYRMKEE